MSSDVQREMLQAGVAVIDHHGAFQRAGLFFPTFEMHFLGRVRRMRRGTRSNRRSSSCLVARRDILPRLIRVSRAQMALSD